MKRVAAAIACILALPATAQGPYPPDTWEFTLEFRRMKVTPVCREKYGKGRMVQTKRGRNPSYVLTGFPGAGTIWCELANGGAFEIDAAWFFDLPEDGVWGDNVVESMGPGDIRAVRARYTDKNIGPFVEGTFWFDTIKGRIKESGGSMQMWDAIAHGLRP